MTTQEINTSGYFRARILKDGRITIDGSIRELFDLRPGDLCRFRFVAMLKRQEEAPKT